MSTTKVVLALAFGGLIGGAFIKAYAKKGDETRVLSRSKYENGHGKVTLLSKAYRLDRIYKSMQGPRGNHPRIRMLSENEPETTVWLTGVRSTIVDDDGDSEVSPEYFCHANLTLSPSTTSPDQHNKAMGTHVDWRLFTLVPGRLELTLPDGFGIPMKGDTSLDYFTMALNQNAGQPERRIRIKTELSYRIDETNDSLLRPLFRRSLYVYQQHQQASNSDVFMSADELKKHQGEACAITCSDNLRGRTSSRFTDLLGESLGDSTASWDTHPGATCCVESASTDGVVPQFGEENTVHWMVPPGRHVYRTEVTEQFNLPFDTTAHYVTGHLHPFGRSIMLRDMDTGETVFEIRSRDLNDRLGVEHMSEFVSQEGVPLSSNRRYELVAEYDNTTRDPIDAMAILYVYALDDSITTITAKQISRAG